MGVIRFNRKNILSRFGILRAFILDNGTQFIGKKVKGRQMGHVHTGYEESAITTRNQDPIKGDEQITIVSKGKKFVPKISACEVHVWNTKRPIKESTRPRIATDDNQE